MNSSVCKGPEAGESWACLSCCREARVTEQRKQEAERSDEMGEVDSADGA